MFLSKCKVMLTLALVLVLSVFATSVVAQRAEQREPKADLAKSQDNLKKIGRAMHAYLDSFGHLPPAAIVSTDGKALLSWRVAILPFLEQEALFKEFKLDEAWDSPHNRKLLSRMPVIYSPPGTKTAKPHSTFYRVFVGPGTVFESKQGCRILDITDGTSATLMVVEAGHAVPWTQPDELPYQKKKALPTLGGLFDGEFNVLMADGSVFLVRKNPDARVMHVFIQRNDGGLVDFDALRKK